MEYRRTKIIATLGPQCSDQKSAQALVEMGVNCFRINLSHGTAAEKKPILIWLDRYLNRNKNGQQYWQTWQDQKSEFRD